MLDLIKFGRYKILEKIGSGGIATVYKAMSYDEKLVALKILSSQDPEDIRRFKREFLLLNSIKHSNIIQVYDFGYTSKTEPYFSMELIRGVDLKTYFRELSLQRFYIALIQICQTLEFIHYKNIIHGDLKPSNVLISSDQKGKLKVKFTDFGFAQFGKSIDSAQWKGSLPYLAPEIIRGEEYNHQVDLYSLGVMMYEVITGELPFKDKDLMDLAKAHLDQEPEFPEDIEIPKVLNEIIQKLLCKDPLDRYYSAQEVINDLREVTEISTKENEILLCKSLVSSHPFIGRNNERSLLKETYQKAQIGESAIVLIKGEFGIGKTKLLKEFKNFIQLNKGVLICGRASDITKIHLANLQDFSKKHLPMVVLLDDFNNLSLKEFDLFLSWVEEIGEIKTLFCLTLEDNHPTLEKNAKASQIELKIESQVKGKTKKIILNPLTKKESIRLVNSSFKWKQDAGEIGELIYESSGGNPYLINWVLTSLLELSYLTMTNQFWQINPEGFEKIELPEIYQMQLKLCLNQLSKESITLLETISVFRKGIVFEHIFKITNHSREKVQECLNETLQQRILKKETISSEERLVFINGMVKNWIFNRLDKKRKKSLYEFYGKFIETHYSDRIKEYLEDLALSYLKAEKMDLALEYYSLASNKAEKEGNHTEAIRYYENTLQLMDKGISNKTLSRLEILIKLATEYRISGNFNKALGLFTKGLELSKQEIQNQELIAKFYHELGVTHLRKDNYESAIENFKEGLSICENTPYTKVKGKINTMLAWVYQRKSDYPQAISHFQEAAELLEKEFSAELGLALNGLGVVYWEWGELSKSLSYYLKALKIFDELGDEERIAAVHMNLGLLENSKGNHQDALNYFKKSLNYQEKFKNVTNLSLLYNNLALTYGNLYDWDKSLEYHQKSYELKEKIRDERGLAITLDNLGIVHLRRGSLNNSIEAHASAIRLLRHLKDRRGTAFSCYNLGKAYLIKGEWSKSKVWLERSLRLRKELNDKAGIAGSLGLLGRLNLNAGDFSSASSQLKESLRIFGTVENQKRMIEISLLLTELGIRQDNTTEAELHLNYVEKLLKSIEDRALEGELRRIRGLFLIQKDKVEKGLKELMGAIEIFRNLKMRYELGLTFFDIGKMKSGAGKYKEAKAYLGEALNIFKHMEIPFRITQSEDLMKGIVDFAQAEVQRTQVLYQITDLLSNITDLDELLLKILDLAVEHLSAERAAVILYYPEDDSLELKAARGIEVETKEDALSISRKVIRNVLKTDTPLIIEDTRNDPGVSLYKSVITHNILSILCVPLIYKDKTIGSIYMDHRSVCGIFSKEDSDFLRAFANLIAVALEKAQYYNYLSEEIFQLKKNIRKTYNYPNIIGKSKKMQEVFHMVKKIADSKTSVLLLGESGTGKELIANLIHHTSHRKDKPCLKVNCAALSESLLESELFGVEEKVATGVAMRDGKFKQADAGTVFFDEIGDMSLSTQAKVLRVLQEREFERVGGSKTIKVDIRVISATNKDLEDCMKKGTFRKDLFYRLNPVTIKIPPLRERKEDIPYMVEYFLEKFSEENKKQKVLVPVKIMNLLTDYPWPGNVRELANLMEKVVLFSEDNTFPKEYLPSIIKSQREKSILVSKKSLSETLDRIEKEMIFFSLLKNNWNQVRAAQELDLSEATLRRKMSKHKIRRPRKHTRQK